MANNPQEIAVSLPRPKASYPRTKNKITGDKTAHIIAFILVARPMYMADRTGEASLPISTHENHTRQSDIVYIGILLLYKLARVF